MPGSNSASTGGRVAAGRATLVQLGDKEGDTHGLIEEAHAIKAVPAGSLVPLLINDRGDSRARFRRRRDDHRPLDQDDRAGGGSTGGTRRLRVHRRRARDRLETQSRSADRTCGLRTKWALMRARRGSPPAPSPASTLAPDPSAAARELCAIVDRAVAMRVDP
jgi:hypothetical protein